MRRLFVLALLAAAVGCGGGSGDDDGADAGVDVCGFASDRYLPFELGFSWVFRVSDPVTGQVKTKSQSVSEMLTHTDGMPALRQTTMKNSGRTENIIRVVGDAVIRLEQEDYTAANVLVRTTEYDPSKIRLDEATDRIADGASWTESYTDIEFDGNGVMVLSTPTTEQWDVLGVDVSCSSPLGTFSCLHIKRTRTVGGTAIKEFWYAKGIGKIREEGGQIEQLTACSTN